MVMGSSYTVNETMLTALLSANNKDASTCWIWTLNLEIIGHTEISIKY